MRRQSLAAKICLLLPLTLPLALARPAFPATNPPADTKSHPAAKPAPWSKDAQAAAARYLDQREVWWQDWPRAQKDHGTFCISCHTQIPYALARPVLRGQLGEQKLSDPERAMLDSILKRVQLGRDAEPFYSDKENGPGKTREARNAESVNNALILASYDAQAGHLQEPTRIAFTTMWANQEKTGAKAGAWIWQNFHYSPWEGDDSEYFGAVMAAIAAATAPDNYRNDPSIQGNLALLRGYLKREAPAQPLENRVLLLWASGKLPGLLAAPEQAAIATEVLAKQQPDGGWSIETMGTFKRKDDSTPIIRSDGYGTGLTVLALEETGIAKNSPQFKRSMDSGIAWLLANQNKTEGPWPSWSVNKQRDPASDIGKFMSDAGTAFAVLALEKSR